MKLLGFTILGILLGGTFSWFTFMSKEDRQAILNRKTFLTILIVSATMIVLFLMAVTGSFVTAKFF